MKAFIIALAKMYISTNNRFKIIYGYNPYEMVINHPKDKEWDVSIKRITRS